LIRKKLVSKSVSAGAGINIKKVASAAGKAVIPLSESSSYSKI